TENPVIPGRRAAASPEPINTGHWNMGSGLAATRHPGMTRYFVAFRAKPRTMTPVESCYLVLIFPLMVGRWARQCARAVVGSRGFIGAAVAYGCQPMREIACFFPVLSGGTGPPPQPCVVPL